MCNFSAQEKEICRYTKTPTGFLMVLRENDDVLAQIENLAKIENIPSASFTGIGFAREVTFGFYDFQAKKFNPKTFKKVEMGSDLLHGMKKVRQSTFTELQLMRNLMRTVVIFFPFMSERALWKSM